MAGNEDSQAWEYSITHSDRLGNTSGVPQIASIWRQRYADGSTDWDHIARMGQEGWEMISAFPVSTNGTTIYVTFVFRRPAAAAAPPAAATEPTSAEPDLQAQPELPAQPDDAAA